MKWTRSYLSREVIHLKDPYKVLGVKRGSSLEEIRSAYKKLVKKYHPDQYFNNPLSDLASEKLKEVNQAYDEITRNGASNNQSNRSYESNYSQNRNYGSSPNYNDIRSRIERGDLSEAERMLNDISNRNAEWNFLRGVIYMQKGWYDQAYEHIRMAVNMEPNNIEYQNALNNLASRGNSYRSYGNNAGYGSGEDCCNICSTLVCLDCLCGILGGSCC